MWKFNEKECVENWHMVKKRNGWKPIITCCEQNYGIATLSGNVMTHFYSSHMSSYGCRHNHYPLQFICLQSAVYEVFFLGVKCTFWLNALRCTSKWQLGLFTHTKGQSLHLCESLGQEKKVSAPHSYLFIYSGPVTFTEVR